MWILSHECDRDFAVIPFEDIPGAGCLCVFHFFPHFSHEGHLTAIPKLLQKFLCNQYAWLAMKVSSLIKALNSVISEDPRQGHGIQTMNCEYSDTDYVLSLAGTHRSVNHLDCVQCHSGEFCRIFDPWYFIYSAIGTPKRVLQDLKGIDYQGICPWEYSNNTSVT